MCTYKDHLNPCSPRHMLAHPIPRMQVTRNTSRPQRDPHAHASRPRGCFEAPVWRRSPYRTDIFPKKISPFSMVIFSPFKMCAWVMKVHAPDGCVGVCMACDSSSHTISGLRPPVDLLHTCQFSSYVGTRCYRFNSSFEYRSGA